MPRDVRRERARIIEIARELHEVEGTCEIDDNAKLSSTGPDGEDGCYVQAWVWVSFANTEFSKLKWRPKYFDPG